LTKTTCSPKSEKPVVVTADARRYLSQHILSTVSIQKPFEADLEMSNRRGSPLVFALVKPTAPSAEPGVMKNEPTEVELLVVAFQAVEVLVVISHVMADRVEGSEEVSAM
jgi:hypothetical protein